MHTNEKRRELTEADVVFMYGAKDPETYRAYGTTVLAWGGAEKKEQVETCLRLGIHPTGAMWCLTAGFVTLKDSAELREAVVRDVAGEPIEVPWLPEGRRNGQPNWWGCFHHPAFHEHLRRQVRAVMAGGAHGLHVDDHLGTAHPAIEYGGCFCGYCMAEFRTFLQSQPEAVWKAAGIGSLEAFDYRELVRKHAMTREAYLKVQDCLPLRREFIEFQLRAAARNVRELHALAEEVAGRPVTLSANAWIPLPPHMVVTPLLTYIVCEVHQHAGKVLAHSGNAVTAYRLADALGKPLAATAAGTDWAFVAAHKAEQLVTYWIAQAYACGQRLMSPSRAWCYTPGTGTSFYAGPTEVYAPFYRFVRRHAALFDGYRAARAPAAVLFDPAGDFFGGGRLLGRMSALADAGIPFDVILAPNAWGLGDPASVAAGAWPIRRSSGTNGRLRPRRRGAARIRMCGCCRASSPALCRSCMC